MNKRSAFCRARNAKTRAYVYGYYMGENSNLGKDSGYDSVYSREYGKSVNAATYKIKSVVSSTVEFTCPITDKKGKRLFEGDSVVYEKNGITYDIIFDEEDLRWGLGWNGSPAIYLNKGMSTQIKLINEVTRTK